jgi:uncharacterized protein YcbK (DUF882 family)
MTSSNAGIAEVNMKPRLMVPLKNFHSEEADCSCGCGKITTPALMIRLQAFIYLLERIYDCQVRCHITGGARCVKHNTELYEGKVTPSYHLGMARGKLKDEYGAAVDIVMEICPRSDWARISKDKLAEHAIESGLFGGVGWKIYGPATRFVHLDLGPVRTF